MTPIRIDEALTDKALLGAALGDATTWATWLTVLRAAFGIQLSRAERRAFAKIAGSRKPPSQRVRELWCIAGRRSGKSRIAAAVACFIACFVPHVLAAGEVGHVLVLAATKDQAATVFKYAEGFLQASPVLSQEVVDTTSEEIRLRGNVVIAVHVGSYRTVRGKTLLAVIGDEVSYWRDEASAQPDVETFRACAPSLAASGGLWIGISSPYRKIGLLHQKHRDHYGVDNPDVLIVQGESTDFNATIDAKIIAQAYADDPESAASEWGASFRADISNFLDDHTIDQAVDHDRPLDLPPRSGVVFHAFADPSGGRRDAFVLTIGHKEGDGFVADVVRGYPSPFNPKTVVHELAALCRAFRVRTVTGDNFAAEWVASEFRDAGLIYKRSDQSKSELYLESLALWSRAAIHVPNNPKLLRELRLLERRTSRIGRDIVDHGRGGTDDFANAVCGCAVITMRKPAIPKAVVGHYGRDYGQERTLISRPVVAHRDG